MKFGKFITAIACIITISACESEPIKHTVAIDEIDFTGVGGVSSVVEDDASTSKSNHQSNYRRLKDEWKSGEYRPDDLCTVMNDIWGEGAFDAVDGCRFELEDPLDLQAYLDIFRADISAWKIDNDWKFDQTTVQYVEGKTHPGWTAFGYTNGKISSRAIHINRIWFEHASPYLRWYIMYHELGHAILSQSHESGSDIMAGRIDHNLVNFFAQRADMFKRYAESGWYEEPTPETHAHYPKINKWKYSSSIWHGAWHGGRFHTK